VNARTEVPDNWAPSPTVFAFRAQWLPLVLPFMAERDIRYYLNGVCVKPWGNGVLIMATDGHALALVYDEKGRADREVIFAVDSQMTAAIRRGGTARHAFKGLEMWIVGERIQNARAPSLRVMLNCGQEYVPGATDAYVQAGNSEIDGKYPDFARVIPRAAELRPGHAGTFQSELLAKLPRRVPSQVRRRSYSAAYRFHSVPFEGGEPDNRNVAVCECLDQPEFMALVMPIRGDTGAGWKGAGLPGWWSDQLALNNLQPKVPA
jgi:hypothetical protein